MNSNALLYPTHNELKSLERQLDVAQDTRELINVFFTTLSHRLPIEGFHYDHEDLGIHIHIGKTKPHQCNYRLLQGNNYFGSVTTFQSHPLNEVSMGRIESLIGILLQPLQDSLRYQTAIVNSCWDPVTRVNNKTAFKRALNTLRNNSNGENEHLNAVFIKLDSLNSIYQKYDKKDIDAMLCHLIDLAHEHCRSTDQIFRFSDDEFVMLLTHTDETQAIKIAHRIELLCEVHQEHIHGSDINCHVSLDVVNCEKKHDCSHCPHQNSPHCLTQSLLNGVA